MLRIGDVRSCGGAVSALSPDLDGVRVTGYRATIPRDIHSDFEIFQIACVRVIAARAIALNSAIRSRSQT